MSKILQIVLGICAALVFIGAVQIIAPQKAMKKSVNFVLGVVFVLVLLVPVTGFKDVRLSFDNFESEEIFASSDLSVYTAEYLVKAALDGAKINYKSVEIFTDILEDNRISITKVKVVSNAAKEEIAAALAELVSGEAVEVINE